jgi:diguanylate cyclase (GGDEF)-like protein
MNPETLEKVLSCKSLPSLPAVALRVIELTQDNSVRTAELAATITNDQGLSAKLLRTVNSSFYALRKPCTSIQQAIVMLGFNAVKTLALGFSLVSSIAEERDTTFDYQAYWRRGLLSGVAGKVFARAIGSRCEEECFLGGLLQDIGMIAMHRSLGAEYAAVLAKAGSDHRQLIRHELADLELSHADVGSMLATRWKLPPLLALPIKYHERPSAAPQECLEICKAVGLGNVAADLLGSSEPGVVLKRLYTKSQELGGLSPADVDAAMKSVQMGVKEVAHLLNLDVGQIKDSAEVIEKAHSQLAAIQIPFAEDASTDNDVSTDPETGVANRLTFNRNLVTGFAQTESNPAEPFSIAILHIDDVAELRSVHGEAYLSTLLANVGHMLKSHFDESNFLVCRFDDERFGVIMARTDRTTAIKVIDGARARIANAPINCQPAGLVSAALAVTLSAGVCTRDLTTMSRVNSPDDQVDLANRAVDAAIRAGGGCSRVYAPRAAA